MKGPSTHIARPLIFSWILVLVALSLILGSGLYSDDMQDFQMRKSMGPLSFSQFWDITCQMLDLFCIQAGRLTPLAHLFHSIIYTMASTILMYKAIILTVNLLAVYSFTRLMRQLGLGSWIPVSLLLFCALAQFYINYHDAYTSLHAMYPFVALFLFSTISLFAAFLRTGSCFTFAAALVMTAVNILHCEIGFILYPIFFILLLADRRPVLRRIVLFFPFLLLFLIYVLVLFYIRSHAVQVYSGVSANIAIQPMLNVLYIQLLATIPLIAFTHMPQIPRFLLNGLMVMWPFIFTAVVVFGLFIRSFSGIVVDNPGRRIRLVALLVAISLWVLPALILMFSAKYQQEMHVGMGYLPVFVQNFGLIILLVLLLDFLLLQFPARRQRITNIFLSLFFIIFLFSFLRNSGLIRDMNEKRSIPSCLYYKSLKNGILSGCPAGSVIVLGSDFFWRSPWWYELIIKNLYKKDLPVVARYDFPGPAAGDSRDYYLLEHDVSQHATILSRIMPDGTIHRIRQMKYPTGSDFSFFELISTPL